MLRNEFGKEQSLSNLCGLFGKSRQAYYQYNKSDLSTFKRDTVILETIITYREEAPRLGAFKLYIILLGILGRENMMGRDAFFNFMSAKRLMLKPSKGRRTTNSNHRFHKYTNLTKGFVPTSINQLWVSDITYIETADGICYLHLITDAYSHKIIGWVLAPTLQAIYTLEALEDAIAQTGKNDLSELIHHSDRGSQYCSKLYVDKLNEYNIKISMTQDYKPTDNAIAERVNGILKQEWLYVNHQFKDEVHARGELARIILFYNTKRPHMSNNMNTPEQVHSQGARPKRCWKNKIYLPKQQVM